jgi:hypothetical protein
VMNESEKRTRGKKKRLVVCGECRLFGLSLLSRLGEIDLCL